MKRLRFTWIFSLIFLVSFLLNSCASVAPLPDEGVLILPTAKEPVWINTSIPGVLLLQEHWQNELIGGAVLALEISGMELFLTSADPRNKAETRSSKTSEFAENTGALIAVNASPFSPVDILNRSGRGMDIVGIQGNDGQLVSQSNSAFDALYVLENGQILIASQETVPEMLSMAVGGFNLLLDQRKILGKYDTRHPRTAIGIDEGQKYLYIAVFDGRQKERAGLTTLETAIWMKWIGCYSAINMDGGGSSSLVINENGTVRVLNSPIHRGKPGLERAVGNNLGFIQKSP